MRCGLEEAAERRKQGKVLGDGRATAQLVSMTSARPPKTWGGKGLLAAPASPPRPN